MVGDNHPLRLMSLEAPKVKYMIRVLGDQELPADHAWVLIQVDSTIVFCVKAASLSAAVVAEAWAAYRSLTGQSPQVPHLLGVA